MYFPGEVAANETALGVLRENLEYVEVYNSGDDAADMTQIYIAGIGYTFPDGMVLAANAYTLVVKNILQFRIRYGTSLNALIAGQYTGSLNNAGEKIELGYIDVPIFVFTYKNSSPWPREANGRI
jgi:hypothetical protein